MCVYTHSLIYTHIYTFTRADFGQDVIIVEARIRLGVRGERLCRLQLLKEVRLVASSKDCATRISVFDMKHAFDHATETSNVTSYFGSNRRVRSTLQSQQISSREIPKLLQTELCSW